MDQGSAAVAIGPDALMIARLTALRWSPVMASFTPLSAAIGGALIGLSAVLLMLSTGRIAGICGIFSGLLNLQGEERGWRTAFVGGLVLAPVIAGWVGHGMAMPARPVGPSLPLEGFWSASAHGSAAAARRVTASAE
jgi:hypothetical protein